MPKANRVHSTPPTNSAEISTRAQRRDKLADGMLSIEPSIYDSYCATGAVMEMYAHCFTRPSDDTFPSIRKLVEAGYRVYLFTEREDEVFAHLVYKAADEARELKQKYVALTDSSEGGADAAA